MNLDNSIDDSDQACTICMDQWTSSGDHRVCCLRCGHLFGYSCILKWLQCYNSSGNRRCPQCNKKATVKHIRLLYAKKVTSKDTGELENVKQDLQRVTVEKNQMQTDLSQCNIRLKVYEQQLICMQSRVSDLENRLLEINSRTNQNAGDSSAKKFQLERSIDICKDAECRVLDYNPWYKYLVVSHKRHNGFMTRYGVRKIYSENFDTRQFIFLHDQALRDITFHSMHQTLLLSVGFDGCANLVDIQNNMTVHTFHTERPLWSCCWLDDNPNFFLVGAQNGSITRFDIRQTSSSIDTLNGPGDRSPVVSLATVPPNPGNGISRGGFIACRLNTCYMYEANNSEYLPKHMCLEGPFISVRYDEKNNHALISSRPNARQPHARHVVCTVEKDSEDALVCNAVHTFFAGRSQHLLSRPCHIHMENETLVAAYHEETNSNISLWSTANGEKFQTLPASDSILDLCSFTVQNELLLASLSAKKLRLYNYK